jgi:hypothetical protein
MVASVHTERIRQAPVVGALFIPMKTLKSVLLVGAAAVAAALLVGAGGKGGTGDARPSFVASENWIAVSDQAGFALSAPKGDSIGAELYVKTEGRWLRGRVENPVTVMPVKR